MTQKNIFTAAEAEDLAVYFSDSKVRTNIVTTGEHMQLIWAKFEPDGRYQLHSHPHEQVSVMLQGTYAAHGGRRGAGDWTGRYVVRTGQRASRWGVPRGRPGRFY